MEDLKLKCPLCCDIFFNSKQQLLDHLTKRLDNLFCPICNNKWSTVDHLIEHLTLDNCQNNSLSNSISLDDDPQVLNIGTTAENTVNENITDSSNSISENNFPEVQTLDSVVENGEVGKIYGELLRKQLLKPCFQTQELKLVKHDGGTHYVIITQPSAQLSVDTIVARQNNDGTISMTTVEDMQMSSDTLIAPTENEPEDNQEEVYSCNTCGVSFTSVLDHIQNYHNDQDVVVEEPVEEPENDVQFVTPEDTAAGDKLASRRMITETGDIVVEPSLPKDEPLKPEPPPELIATSNDGAGQSTRVYATRYVKIDNLCDSVVRDIKESENKNENGPYHKVVVKELKTQTGTIFKMYHCKSCQVYKSDLKDFKTDPCKPLKYACSHCPVTYGNAKSLYAHMKVHKTVDPDAPVTYECGVCSTKFPTNKSLKLHKRMHDPMKIRPIELPVENKDGSIVSSSKYLCQICDKLIPMDYRTVHQNSHKSDNMYNCSICNKKFTSNGYLDMHMKVHNLYKVTVTKQDNLLPYKCLYCHRKFARPHEKVKHERIHTGEKPHSCEICGKSFRVSYCLTLHMRTHTGARPYACPLCGKRFKAHSVYNHHLLTHSDVRAYKCPYCPKTFKTSVQLAGHKNCHTKPFSCQHCNRPFASLYAVRVHMETHLRQNNLKFSCSLCGASYARAFALKDHVKQAHDRDVDAKENELTTQDEEWTQRETENVQTLSKELLPTEIRIVGISNNDTISS